MKKTLIAATIAALASGAVNAAEIYKGQDQSITLGGRAEGRMKIEDGNTYDKTRLRLNVKGKAQLTESAYGVGFFEIEYKDDGKIETNTMDRRYAYAGIGGTYGEVVYGKAQGSLGVITDFTDIMAYHGNSAATKLQAADRDENNLRYAGKYQDLSVMANYRFEEADLHNGGFSLSSIYAFTLSDLDFKVGAGYAEQDMIVGTRETDSDEFMVSSSMKYGNIYLAGLYTDGSFDNEDYTGYEFAAGYTLGKTVFTTTYNNADIDDNTLGGGNADNLAFDATYFFNPNFRSYISYNFNFLDEDADKKIEKRHTEDSVALGMRYDF